MTTQGSQTKYECSLGTLTSLILPDGMPNLAKKCTLNCKVLDNVLGGGMNCGQITEIVGESGVGKTQLCFQLMLSAQLDIEHGGLKGSSVYLHSDGPVATNRLHTLAEDFVSRTTGIQMKLKTGDHNPLDMIMTKCIKSPEQLLSTVNLLDGLLQARANSVWPVKVIIVDSIASIFRSSFNYNGADMRKRANMFFKLSALLRLYAHRYNLVVVTTNQVTDVVNSAEYVQVGNDNKLLTSGGQVCPSLGLSWSNCINSRFFMALKVRENGQIGATRTLQVVFSPCIGMEDAHKEFITAMMQGNSVQVAIGEQLGQMKIDRMMRQVSTMAEETKNFIASMVEVNGVEVINLLDKFDKHGPLKSVFMGQCIVQNSVQNVNWEDQSAALTMVYGTLRKEIMLFLDELRSCCGRAHIIGLLESSGEKVQTIKLLFQKKDEVLVKCEKMMKDFEEEEEEGDKVYPEDIITLDMLYEEEKEKRCVG